MSNVGVGPKTHKNVTSIFSSEQTNCSLVFWSGRYGRSVWPNHCKNLRSPKILTFWPYSSSLPTHLVTSPPIHLRNDLKIMIPANSSLLYGKFCHVFPIFCSLTCPFFHVALAEALFYPCFVSIFGDRKI
jgi:hypothetical protein